MTGHRFGDGCRRCTLLGTGHRAPLFRSDLERRIAVTALYLTCVLLVLVVAFMDGAR